MRTAINLRLFLILGFLLTCLGQVPARAETSLIEMLKVNPEWAGTVDATKRLAVTFDVSGDPPTLKNISYRWETESRRYAVEFRLDDRSIEFMIPPGDRNRWYKLELTDDEQLLGTLTGLSRNRQYNFQEFVLLRPVGNAEARVEAESAIIREVRKSAIYEYVGNGPMTLDYYIEDRLRIFDADATSSLFFITEDGSDSYKSWCDGSGCDTWGDPEFVKKECEDKYGKECFLYKVGSNFAISISGAFRDKVVWDFWYKPAEELERERLAKEEENRRAEEEKRRRVEKEQAREAEIANLKRELEDRRKAGGTVDTVILAEVERLKREADEARKALQARKAQEAEEAKIHVAELARLRKEIEGRRKAEVARKTREAKQAKAREARETEIARLKAELEEARKAREPDESKTRESFEDIEFGRYYALVIGIDNYKYLPKLKTAVNDAKAVARMLTEEYGFRLTLLLNPDHREIIDTFDEYREKLGPQDNLLIYYAGHGWLDEEVDRGYWLPVNAKPKRRSGWVSNATITDTLKGLAAKHVMVVADSCYSGTLVRGAGMGVRTRTGKYWKQLAAKWARVVITSGGLEPVADKGGSGHSPFAKAFIDALGENTSVMDGMQLFTRMRRPVMVAADQTPEYSDVRNAGHDGGDFIFVRRN